MSNLRAALILLRRARRQWKMKPTQQNAAVLQRAQHRFDKAKREAIKALD